MTRKLATIERIMEISTHPNADTLEIATIRAWQVVVRKGEFKEGDLCVYCEIDSVLPERTEFEFLRPRHFRIKTAKIRGELSQGICFPLSILDDWVDHKDRLTPGKDVTQQLDIGLYEPPIPASLGGDVVGSFPTFIPKTDCERIQNHPWILDEYDYTSLAWAATEKLDGSSCTVFWKDDTLHVCSRNWEMKETENNAHWQAVNRAGLATKLKNRPFALQGELIGPGIQKNRYGLAHLALYFFDAYSLEEQQYLSFFDFKHLCGMLDVETVPVIGIDYLRQQDIASLLLEAEGKSKLNPKTEREGLVWKPTKERSDPRIGRLIFKAISNRLLLKAD